MDKLLSHPPIAALLDRHGRILGTAVVRAIVDELRSSLLEGNGLPDAEYADPDRIAGKVEEALDAVIRPRLRRAINATGVILHTGLGRAVLPAAAVEALAAEMRGYSLLEIDAATGDRSKRERHVVDLLREITGAEMAVVVNNNAAATFLALSTLAQGREVICSRGQMVEIGESFRIPDVMKASGATLVDVGTTNKTHLKDYEAAITDRTALLLRVHGSNFRVVGFTDAVPLADLVALGKRAGVPVMDDLGSGALIDLGPFGLKDEPIVHDSVRAGADVVCFSGDKLLGGPQAGILVGRTAVLQRLRKSPLYRALRVDKLTLTALEATLKLFLDPERALRDHPTLRMLAMTKEELGRAADDLAARLRKAVPKAAVTVEDDASQTGGGSVPGLDLPTRVVAIAVQGLGADALARRLRLARPSVFARIVKDRVVFDPRTLQPGEAEELVALAAAATR